MQNIFSMNGSAVKQNPCYEQNYKRKAAGYCEVTVDQISSEARFLFQLESFVSHSDSALVMRAREVLFGCQ
jgi:hypothetical protein